MLFKDIAQPGPTETSWQTVATCVHDLGEQLRRRRGRYKLEPLSTGSLSLDHATGVGGLPRGRIVRLSGDDLGNLRVAEQTIAHVQKHHGVVALLSPAELAGMPELARPATLRMLMARAASAEELVRMALLITQQDAADLIVIRGLASSPASLFRRNAPTLSSLEALSAAVKGSRCCVLVLDTPTIWPTWLKVGTWPSKSKPLAGATQLHLKPVSKPLAGGSTMLQVSVSSVAGTGRSASFELSENGQVSRVSDVFDLATANAMIQRSGTRYRYADFDLGMSQGLAEKALAEQADLSLQLESALEGQVDALRDKAVRDLMDPKPGNERTAAPAQVPEPEAAMSEADTGLVKALQDEPAPRARYVRTWFDGPNARDPLPVRHDVEFCFQIGSKAATSGGIAAPFAEPDWGDKDAIDLLVTLYSVDFDIEAHHHPFLLFRTGDSQVQKTRVSALHAGPCRLRLVVSLARELEVLQVLDVEVAAMEVRSAAAQAGA